MRWIALMRRREFITLAGGIAVWPLAARAQQSMPVVGYVTSTTVKLSEGYLAGVSKELAEQGYIEGKDFRFELREANFHVELMPGLFRELVDQKVSVWRPPPISAIAHHFDCLSVPVEVRPHVGATMAASCADESRLNVGQPEICTCRAVVACLRSAYGRENHRQRRVLSRLRLDSTARR
jgi:hypothetical protein